jgi:hypothetical protein
MTKKVTRPLAVSTRKKVARKMAAEKIEPVVTAMKVSLIYVILASEVRGHQLTLAGSLLLWDHAFAVLFSHINDVPDYSYAHSWWTVPYWDLSTIYFHLLMLIFDLES